MDKVDRIFLPLLVGLTLVGLWHHPLAREAVRLLLEQF